MKAILEFDFDHVDDVYEHLRSIKSRDMYLVLFKFNELLANEMNNGNVPQTPEYFRELLNETMYSLSIDLNELGE